MLVALLQATDGNDINADAKQVLKVALNIDEIKECSARFKLNEKIEVARSCFLPASHRAEESDTSGAVNLRDAPDLLAMLIHECPEPSHARRLLPHGDTFLRVAAECPA